MTYQFDFAALLPYWDEFLRGIGLTLLLSVLAVAIGFVIGLVTVLARQSRWAGLRVAAVSYVEVIRNTPFLLQVMFIFFGLPSAGVSLTPWPAAILALSLNCGAFASEIIRGGIDAVPRGQAEAGAALGLQQAAGVPLRHPEAGAADHLSGALVRSSSWLLADHEHRLLDLGGGTDLRGPERRYARRSAASKSTSSSP